jgi:hypothetical protein
MISEGRQGKDECRRRASISGAIRPDVVSEPRACCRCSEALSRLNAPMTTFPRAAFLVIAAALTGCSSPTLQMKDASFATGNLQGALAGERVATRTEYREGKDMCRVVREKDRLQVELRRFGGEAVAWDSRRAGDVTITSRWMCSGNAGTDGLADAAGAVASLFTLGLLPSVRNRGYLSLEVTIERGKAKLFAGSYRLDRDVVGNAYSDQDESFAQDYGRTADVLIAQFLEELDRDGALDK